MIKTLSHPPVCPPVKPARYFALGLTLAYASLAVAQNAPTAPIAPAVAASSAPPTPANSAAPMASDVSVLIVALDDLSAPDASAIPTFVPPTTPVAPDAPIAPADSMPAVVTPTNFGGQLWQWKAEAQKKPKKTKEQKRLEKEAKDAELFNINPVAPTPYTPPGRANPLTENPAPDVIVPGVTGQPVAGPPVVRTRGEDLAAKLAPNVLPVNIEPGRSQLMAVPLRRVLMSQGYKDVQVVTPQSNAIMRAIGEGRLSTRVLDELKRSLATLAANNAAGVPADVSATIVAGRAASRIGQATGYRAVVGFYVAAPTSISLVGAGAASDAKTQKVVVNMVVADAQRESVEPLQLVETGDNENVWRETGAAAGAQLLDTTLRDWPANSSDNRPQLAQVHFDAARSAFQNGDLPRAQDEVNQSLALDGTRADSYVLRGDVLNAIEPGDGLAPYQKAVELNSQSGQDWARIAIAYASANAKSKTPDWRPAWNAGNRALSLNYDSAALRVAIATAQYGRAELFRVAKYPSQADAAEADARVNLERALQLSPDDPTAVRLLAKNLLEKKHYEEAARTLDRIAPRYPNDVEIQGQYAVALGNQIGREEDAFAAYARVWKLSGQKSVNVDSITYRTLATGFDQRLFNLGKVAVQLSRGVASRAILRETALIQLGKLKEEMDNAQQAIGIMQPVGVGATAVAARVFAANLMDQSLESFQTYLDTGQGEYFQKGDGLYRTAVASLNSARSAQ